MVLKNCETYRCLFWCIFFGALLYNVCESSPINCFLLFLQKMKSIKCNKNVILQKKIEIKTIIDDFREFTEVCGSNYSEKTVNTKKNTLLTKEISFVMKKMTILKI